MKTLRQELSESDHRGAPIELGALKRESDPVNLLEISDDDMETLKAINSGVHPRDDEGVKWLAECGLVETSGNSVSLTQFAKEWLF